MVTRSLILLQFVLIGLLDNLRHVVYVYGEVKWWVITFGKPNTAI